MSAPANMEALSAIFDAYRTRAFEQASELFAPDAEVQNVPTGDVYRGPGGYLQYARGWASAFPDLAVDALRLDAMGETAIAEYRLRGTHTGAVITTAGFIPPTWAQVEIRVCDVVEFRDGKVQRMSCYFDSATMLRQMGLLPNSPLHSADRRAPLELYATEVDASAEQRNRAVVERFLEEVVNQKNPAAALAGCSPDLVWHGGILGEASDLPGFQSLLAAIFASFPDLHVEVHDTIAEQDRVAVRLTLRGTHLGEFQGVPPTGKKVTSAGMNTFRIVDNQIVEQWWQNDLLGVMRQLDALPAAAPPL